MKDSTGGMSYEELVDSLSITDLYAVKKLLKELGEKEFFVANETTEEGYYEWFDFKEYVNESIMYEENQRYNKKQERRAKVKSLVRRIIKK